MTQKQTDFIEHIGKAAREDMKKSHILASLTIAQAILESGWGESSLAVKGNALFGIKAGSNWTGKVYTAKTSEYIGGEKITITDDFRAYESWADSIADHSALLCGLERYAAVVGETDYKTACRAIQAAGYATAPDYADELIKIIEQYGLTRFDRQEVNNMSAIDKLIAAAEGEVGYIEKKTNSQLDDKTANAGGNNYTKYWRDIRPDYQGQPWCACFVTWVFVQAFDKGTAERLLKHYPYVYCPTIAGLFTLNANPKRGDIVLFYRNGVFAHTGIVINVNGDYFETIEGNTSGASGITPNGGGVVKKHYYNSQLPGTKFVTVDWSLVEEGLTVGQYEALKQEISALKSENETFKQKISSLEDKVGGMDDVYDWNDDNMPEWIRSDVQWMQDRNIIRGDDTGRLGLSPIKLWVIAVITRTARYLGKLMGVKM